MVLDNYDRKLAKSDVQWENPADFDDNGLPELPELINGLRTITRTKLKYGRARANLKIKVEVAERELKRTEAKHRAIAVTHKETLTSSNDRDGWVREQKEVIDAEDELMARKIEYEHAKLLEQYCDDEFVSLRKQANLLQQYNEDIRRATDHDD